MGHLNGAVHEPAQPACFSNLRKFYQAGSKPSACVTPKNNCHPETRRRRRGRGGAGQNTFENLKRVAINHLVGTL